jgi:RNA polymerase sigma factor (sigma-70 family)
MGINLNSATKPVAARQFSDEEFIDGLRSGNSQALAALYKKYYGTVLKFIVNNSGSSEEAADVYQETVIILYENANKQGFSLSCQLGTYIFSVARRLWLNQLRRSGRTFLFREEEENGIADVAHDLGAHLKKEEDLTRMDNSLNELGEPCATLITDFYVKQMSMEAIAAKFGYTNADNAKTQKYKCLQRLKRSFFESIETK